MKVHFIGALEGSKKDYQTIIGHIKHKGYELITDHSVSRSIEDVEKESSDQAEFYAKQMRLWIMQADVVVVEATYPGFGTGYEIATAFQLDKSIVVVYRESEKNRMFVLKGIKSDKLQVHAYTDESIGQVLSMALEFAKETIDIRFNFFISPPLERYLNWITKTEKIPRSVFLRGLIEKHMARNKTYLKENTKSKENDSR